MAPAPGKPGTGASPAQVLRKFRPGSPTGPEQRRHTITPFGEALVRLPDVTDVVLRLALFRYVFRSTRSAGFERRSPGLLGVPGLRRCVQFLEGTEQQFGYRSMQPSP